MPAYAALQGIAGCSGSSVDLTWLGVTSFFVRYRHGGRTVKLLLDAHMDGSIVRPVLDDLLGSGGELDYMFVGHNHFDHTGLCGSGAQEELLRKALGIDYAFTCVPFQDLASNYSMRVVGPKRMCDLVHEGTSCTPLIPRPESLTVLELDEVGLRVTAVPAKHSMNVSRGAPGCSDPLACPDTHGYLFEFAGETPNCGSSFYWQDSINSVGPPYLEGTGSGQLDYARLLKMAFQRSDPRVTFMAIPSNFVLNEAAWTEFAAVVRPRYHASIHTGLCSEISCDLSASKDYPHLAAPFPGDADPHGNDVWFSGAKVPASNIDAGYSTPFLNISDYFDTIRLCGPVTALKVDLGYAQRFRSMMQQTLPASALVV
jgi:hypothetical protein